MQNSNIKEIIKSILFKIKNLNVNLPLDNIFLRSVLVSFFSFVVFFGLTLGVIWHYRAEVFSYFAKEYLQAEKTQLGLASQNDLKVNEKINGESLFGQILEKENVPVLTQEETLVDVVKKTNPAVVSIILTKEVPKYETYIDPNQQSNPFENFFPGFNFNIPQYRQNGTEKKEIGGGSGFLVTNNGLIVTNKHVVDQKDVEYSVFTNDGKKHIAKVIARDAILDIAILKIEGSNFSYLNLGDSDKLQIGQSVVAIGNALAEFKNTVSVGIVSGLSRSITAGDSSGKSELLDHVIQTDAAINPGNSGGPLIDLSGKVIGVNVAVAQGSQNIGFALPINSVKSVIDSVKKTGRIVRPYLGVRYVAINAEMKEKNNLSVDYGVLVKAGATPSDLAVIPGSPADKAGIVENDIILAVDGRKINDETNLSSVIRQKRVGDVVNLKILSKGIEKYVNVVLEDAKDN
ncbi:MAG: trypsin-like peptidase domain-containing protein [Patescibacteria group bacterium]